jgi:hypothetical protein
MDEWQMSGQGYGGEYASYEPEQVRADYGQHGAEAESWNGRYK